MFLDPFHFLPKIAQRCKSERYIYKEDSTHKICISWDIYRSKRNREVESNIHFLCKSSSKGKRISEAQEPEGKPCKEYGKTKFKIKLN